MVFKLTAKKMVVSTDSNDPKVKMTFVKEIFFLALTSILIQQYVTKSFILYVLFFVNDCECFCSRSGDESSGEFL
jgi:hypothetical protein